MARASGLRKVVLLDADGDGQPGGVTTFGFRTVSTSPLLGTTLSGRLVDPGPDLLPMTEDDFSPGPDGEAHTDDDEYLLPISGVTVFILGLEDEAIQTGAEGRFHFDAVPSGTIKVATDGRTADDPPVGYYFPEMVMDSQAKPGVENFCHGHGGHVSASTGRNDP